MATKTTSKGQQTLKPVIDSLELAISNLSEVDKHHAKGLEITYEMLISTVNKFGLVSINPLGEKFDPKYHDAIATEASGASDNQHTVKSVLQKGYLLNDRVIRPAMVVVTS
ncbi:nucleotide exchange factor GrpE [Vibrio breoganii]